jgi:hypothetical protein
MTGLAGQEPGALLAEWGEREEQLAFATWLRAEASADERHWVATNWNWDLGEEVLYWIVTRPDCDRATALDVFWNGQPEYGLRYGLDRSKVPHHELNVFDLVAEISARWQHGAYTRAELSFDPPHFDVILRSEPFERARYGDLYERLIPSSMLQRLPGRTIPSDGQQEGIPHRFWPDQQGE